MKIKLLALAVTLGVSSYNAAGQSSTAPATPQPQTQPKPPQEPSAQVPAQNRTTSNPSTASSPLSTTSSPAPPASAIESFSFPVFARCLSHLLPEKIVKATFTFVRAPWKDM